MSELIALSYVMIPPALSLAGPFLVSVELLSFSLRLFCRGKTLTSESAPFYTWMRNSAASNLFSLHSLPDFSLSLFLAFLSVVSCFACVSISAC